MGEPLHQRGWRTAFTVVERVLAWAALVSVIERGYGNDIYEYTNDLYCRNGLHDAWLLLDEHIASSSGPRGSKLWTTTTEPPPSTMTARHSSSSKGCPGPTCGGGGDTLASSWGRDPVHSRLPRGGR
ncbi:hypothetical protein SRIMM317S_06943 [Streptomyces rimosus subsp. rimosus]